MRWACLRWWEITIQIPEEATEAVAALLGDWPEVKGVAVEGIAVSAPLHPEYGEWLDDSLLHNEQVSIRAYVPELVHQAELERRIVELLRLVEEADFGVTAPACSWYLTLYDEESWKDTWKDDFTPIEVGRHLLIVPRWDALAQEVTDKLPIILEPGMAFGTGTHATTRLCLQALESVLRPGDRVLDIGCGTAVLSIAAARLGARKVTAIDIDPVAVTVAKANVDDNGVAAVVEVVEGDLLHEVHDDAYQVALANILRDPVIHVTPDAYAKLAASGHFIVSGFITSQQEAVQDALVGAGFTVSSVLQDEDWVALIAEKSP